MPFLPTFAAWQFAVAGLACAALPLIIHLLNRRRFRVVEWAAMDFLREAMKHNRRILQLRDLLLLLLRTAAVLLFGLALARPYFSARNEAFDGAQPLHAILLVDNSLSMGYQTLRGSSLDEARVRARQLIDKLPRGSRISVIPICGSPVPLSVDPYDTVDGAVEALARIEPVDRAAPWSRALNEARRAVTLAPDMAARVVLFGDQQRNNWNDLAAGADALADMPSIQIVDVGPEKWENSWISDLRLQDGLADVETPATVVVAVQYRGEEPRRDVEVKLLVDGQEVAAKSVTLASGEGAQEVAFEFVFDGYQPEPGHQQYVPISAVLPPDNLPADDQRHLVVPVVAALPVVFVDQVAADQEDPLQQRLGETRHLRKLLAPVVRRQDSNRHLVKIRHVTADELTEELLSDARLVVVAGIAAPSSDAVRLLRAFVLQGGPLVIAAGADFDPVGWNDAAWLGGAGILPAPLKPQPLGSLPEETAERLKPFSISFESLANDSVFRLPDMSDDDLRDLYGEPFFFKCVEADLSAAALAELRKSVEDDANESTRPTWLRWNRFRADDAVAADQQESNAERQRRLATAVEQAMPRVLARFSSEQGPPFLVERRIGDGRVLLATSGLLSSWNTLPKTNTMFLMDRLLRGMIHETLPERNFPAQPRVVVPVSASQGAMSATVIRPGRGGLAEPLDIGFVTRDQRGVTISQPLSRGIYTVTLDSGDDQPSGGAAAAASETASATSGAAPTSRRIYLTVQGDADESDLTRLSRDRFDRLAADSGLRWVGRGDEISLAGAQIRGQDSWWYLLASVLGLLLLEIGMLAWPSWQSAAPTATTTKANSATSAPATASVR